MGNSNNSDDASLFGGQGLEKRSCQSMAGRKQHAQNANVTYYFLQDDQKNFWSSWRPRDPTQGPLVYETSRDPLCSLFTSLSTSQAPARVPSTAAFPSLRRSETPYSRGAVILSPGVTKQERHDVTMKQASAARSSLDKGI